MASSESQGTLPYAAQASPQKPRLLPVLTQQSRAPWLWVVAVQSSWFVTMYAEQCSGTAITFTLKKFIDNPFVITLIGSFNLIFNVLVGATCNYMSDRVWTPLGRRRPFLIAGFGTIALFLLLIPFIRNFWVLIAVLFVYEMIRDSASPQEPLINEVVPPPQRGRGMAIAQVIRTLGILFFFSVMFGQFDKTFDLPGGVALRGETLIYWTGSVLALLLVLFYAFGIREVRPAGFTPAPASSFSWRAVRDFLRDVFSDRQNRFIYLVGLSQMIFWIGLGNLSSLMMTEQFGYEKQTIGNIVAMQTPFTLFLFLPLAGWLTDRLNRIHIFVGGAMLMTLFHLVFLLYCRYMAPGGVPPVTFLVVFGLINSAVSNIATIASVAMMFDYVPTSKMGTVSSGLGITRGIASVLVNNGVGLWVWGYSWLFLPKGKYDYVSGYQYLFLLGLIATAMALWFARQDAAGRLVKHGLAEQQERAA